MNQLTQEQIKTLEDAFASYPKDFRATSKYANMKGIQEQLDELKGEPGNIFYISKVNMGEDNHMHFVMDKMKVGETK